MKPIQLPKTIAVAYLARGASAEERHCIQLFQESYRRFDAGREHTLYVLYKGFPTQESLDAARASFSDIPHRPRLCPDEGLDIGSYRLTARSAEEEYFFFLNTKSRLCGERWLEKMARWGTLPDVGIAGVTSSYATLKLPGFPPFPNPHVRSNGFLIRRELFLEIVGETQFREKRDAWLLESGPRNMTRQIVAKGLKAYVVGRNGRGYEAPTWATSGTFRTKGQKNLLIRDNQTHAHEETLDRALWEKRIDEANTAWGPYRYVEFFGPQIREEIKRWMAAPIPPPVRRSSKPRVFAVVPPHWGPVAVRVRAPLASLLRQGLIETATVVDSQGRLVDGQVTDGIDALWVQRDPPPWFASFAAGSPYLADLDELLSHVPPSSPGQGEQENRERTGRLYGMIADASLLTIPHRRLLEAVRQLLGIPAAASALVPNGFHFPDRPLAVAKPRGLIWSSSDLAPLGASGDAILGAVDEFSARHDLPVYCIGVFRPETTQRLRKAVLVPPMDYAKYGSFLAKSGTLLGIAPLETQASPETLAFIACKSDVKMVDYGGFGHPAVYSAAAPYTDTDLRTGRVVPNTFEAWIGALEDLYRDGYKEEEANARAIREKRHIDRIARECWMPALEKVRLEEPMPFPTKPTS